LRYSQCSADASHRPAQAPLQANWAQAIWKRLSTGPTAQSLRAAQQIMSGLFGRYVGAVYQFQRRELLGVRYSAAGAGAMLRCLRLHRLALSTQQHRPGMVHTFFGATLALKTAKSRCNPHKCWVSRGIACPGFSCPICPVVLTLIAVCFVHSICP